MRTIKAQRIILEILAGRRTATGNTRNGIRPRRMREWDLAKIARRCFHDTNGHPLLPHLERALFARGLQGLRRDGMVRLKTQLPGVLWVSATKAGLQAIEAGWQKDHDPEAEATKPCPRCGYYNPEADKSCQMCGETLTASPAQIAEALSKLPNPDIFMSSQMTWLWLRRWGIYAAVIAPCIACLFLVAFILEGTALVNMRYERLVIPAATMSLLLGIAAGYCIVRIRAGFYSGIIFFTAAYLVESAVRIAVGGTTYSLWDEAIRFHLVSGLPMAMACGALIGHFTEHIVHAHGGG